VDTARFQPATRAERLEIRARLGIEPDSPVATFVGAIIPRKGVDVLVEAWRAVQAAEPRARLLMVGPDTFGSDDRSASELVPFIDGLKRTVADAGLRVDFVGRQERVEDYLRAADVFVLPSRKEGFGNVIIEALACGLPAVVTAMDGVGSVTVSHGENGFIVHNAGEIADALIRLFQSSELTARMGVAARHSATDKFGAEFIARRYVELYEATRSA
jgi:glycosyltransferase involved in cell wall biosynthesis